MLARRPTTTAPNRFALTSPLPIGSSIGSASTTASTPTSRRGSRDGEHHFLINPYGMLFEEITASNLVKIDLDGQHHRTIRIGSASIRRASRSTAPSTPRARTRSACCTPTRTPAWRSPPGGRLLPLNQWSMQFTERLAYHDYEGIALNLDERERLVADLGDNPSMILRNHGLLTCGRSVGRSIQADAQHGAIVPGAALDPGVRREVIKPSAAVARKTAGQYASVYDSIEVDGKPDNEWAAFKRMLERTDPDFMN